MVEVFAARQVLPGLLLEGAVAARRAEVVADAFVLLDAAPRLLYVDIHSAHGIGLGLCPSSAPQQWDSHLVRMGAQVLTRLVVSPSEKLPICSPYIMRTGRGVAWNPRVLVHAMPNGVTHITPIEIP